MSKRPIALVDGYQIASPRKFRKTLTPILPFKGARQLVAPVLQNPTPEKSYGTATASTTASKSDPYYEFPTNKYSLVATLRTLGSGGQARAVLCQSRGGKQFVVKFFKKSKYAHREARIIRQIHGSAGSAANRTTLNHPRIVGLHDGPYNNFPGYLLTTDGPEWAILLEYAKGNTLSHCKSEYLKLSRPVPEMLIWKYFYQMAEALAFMHWGYGTRDFDPKNPYGREYSFVHRDLKPDNVLRTSTPTALAAGNTWGDPYPNIQLCDFGMSDKITKDEFSDIKTGGSEYWQPPEQCQPPNVAGPAQDVWAMGAIIHYLALGEPPCDGTNPDSPLEEGANWRASLPRKVTSISMKPQDRTSMFKGVVTGHLRTEFHKADADKKCGGTYSQLLDHYMQRCLQLDVDDRATSWEILREMGGVFKDLMAKSKGNPGGFTRRVRNMSV